MTIRLQGPRVTLRAFRVGEDDILWAHERASRAPGGAWADEQVVRDRLRARAASSGTWTEQLSLLLAVEAHGRLIGDVQARTSHDVFPPGLYELGIDLFEVARGCGYGSETLEVLTRFLFDDEQAARVQLGTDVDNAAMRRAAEKAGFAFEGVMRGFWPVPGGDPRDYALYGRTRADHEEPDDA